MADRFCMASPQKMGCGCNFSTVPYKNISDNCPNCGEPHTSQGVYSTGAVGATARKVCPKCGLMQHSAANISGKSNHYHGLKCVNCNQPLITYDEGGTLDYCIRCGRIYDSRYAARHGNGSVGSRLVRCPKCGGNTKTYPAT